MSEIKISKEDTEALVIKIKQYFVDELDREIGGFEAEFLIDFFAKEIGPQFYNRGVSDAHSLYLAKTEEVGYMIQDLEKIT